MVMFLWNFVFEKCPEDLSTYDSVDRLTGQPKKCFVKLSEVGW